MPWKGRTIYDLLTDGKYIGQIVHKGQAYPGEHAAIIESELFEQVQTTLRANKTYTHRHQVQRFALLRRMLRCGHCDSLIQPVSAKNHGREYHYYTCTGGSRRATTTTRFRPCPPERSRPWSWIRCGSCSGTET